jgi:hypothetical protein
MAWKMLASQLLPRAVGAVPLSRLSAVSPGVRQLAAVLIRPHPQHLSIGRGGFTRLATHSMSTISSDALREAVQNELTYEQSEYVKPEVGALPVSPNVEP